MREILTCLGVVTCLVVLAAPAQARNKVHLFQQDNAGDFLQAVRIAGQSVHFVGFHGDAATDRAQSALDRGRPVDLWMAKDGRISIVRAQKRNNQFKVTKAPLTAASLSLLLGQTNARFSSTYPTMGGITVTEFRSGDAKGGYLEPRQALASLKRKETITLVPRAKRYPGHSDHAFIKERAIGLSSMGAVRRFFETNTTAGAACRSRPSGVAAVGARRWSGPPGVS